MGKEGTGRLGRTVLATIHWISTHLFSTFITKFKATCAFNMVTSLKEANNTPALVTLLLALSVSYFYQLFHGRILRALPNMFK
jgi:hypothetical protein